MNVRRLRSEYKLYTEALCSYHVAGKTKASRFPKPYALEPMYDLPMSAVDPSGKKCQTRLRYTRSVSDELTFLRSAGQLYYGLWPSARSAYYQDSKYLPQFQAEIVYFCYFNVSASKHDIIYT